MVNLFCAIAGVIGSVFDVDIDEHKPVSQLKKVIKDLSQGVVAAPWKLELFLAKKDQGRGPWLTEAEVENGVIDTAGLKHLKSARAAIGASGLSSGAVQLQPTDRNVEDLNLQTNGPIHVVVVTPEQRQQLQAEDVQREKIRQDLIRLSRERSEFECELRHKTSTPYTIGMLGSQEYQRLDSSQLVFDTAPVENGEAFWSKEIQTQADAITMRTDFDAFISPYLNDVLARCGMVFVNSAYPWLSLSVNKRIELKLDGFATHTGMYREPVPNDGEQHGDGYRFGVPEEELYDCLVLFESKLKIDNAAFGQVVRYLENIRPTASACAVLFDRHSFWLITSFKSVICKIEKSTWVSKGSKTSFQNFIARNISPLVTLLSRACSSLRVNVVEGDAFLGRGAIGRVFKTTRQGGGILALNIVEQDSVGRLYHEKCALDNAQDTGLTIRAVEDVCEIRLGARNLDLIGAALLLCPMGAPLRRPQTQAEVQRLFELLWQLHAKGWAHGDPRVPNVLVSEGKLLWLGLTGVLEATEGLKEIDVFILSRPILRLRHDVALDAALELSIRNYANSSTLENANQLAKVVFDLNIQKLRWLRKWAGICCPSHEINTTKA